jgi:alpha-D-glucose phosphate-specific phosphoglucomutase
VTEAIANYLHSEGIAKNGVVIGYDTRFLSKEFAITSYHILSQKGIPVWLTNRDTPTPVISYHIIKKKAGGGINFTASHNPPEYNGIKFSPSHGGPAEPEVTSKIEKEIDKLVRKFVGVAPTGNSHKVFNPAPQYLKHVKGLIRTDVLRKAKLKVVIDCMHGTSRDYLDSLLKECGCSVKTLNTNLDPLFGGHRPEPAEENIIGLKNEVKGSVADIGLATDGDGDRFGIIDSDGTYITPNQVICLLFDYLVKTRNVRLGGRPKMRNVARSVATTSMVDAIAQRHGIEVIETPVGFKFIGKLISEGDCIIGGEESGGLSIGGHLPEKDGILACLLVSEMVASVRRPIRDILKALYKEAGRFYGERLDIHLTQEAKDALLNRLNTNPPEKIAGTAVLRINRIDGFKFILIDGSWVLFRPSGTEPIVRIYLESSSSKKLKEMIDEVKGTVPVLGLSPKNQEK